MAADQNMLSVLPYLRAEQARALRGRAPAGALVSPDEDNGLSCPVWVHPASSRAEGRPVVLEFHGGGFALGSAQANDGVCERVAHALDACVVGVDYRLAPEHPAPAQRKDALAALAAVRAGRLPGVPPSARVVLMGFSAGACIALSAALAAAREGGGEGLALALFYPFLDADAAPQEQEGLPSELVAAFDEWYLAGGADARDPLVSPLFAGAAELAGLGPCAICPVEGDYLAAQALALAQKMPQARVFSTDGVSHGYIEAGTDPARAREQMRAAFDWIFAGGWAARAASAL